MHIKTGAFGIPSVRLLNQGDRLIAQFPPKFAICRDFVAQRNFVVTLQPH